MTAKLGLSAGLAFAILVAGSLTPAVAQTTPAEVQVDLNTNCVAAANGTLVDQAACLGAVSRAISAANALATAGQPGSVDIGFYLGQLMADFPFLAQQIVDLIDASGNGELALGVSNALPAGWVGPRPIISPA